MSDISTPQLLRCIVANNFAYSPYTASVILEQMPEAVFVRSVYFWNHTRHNVKAEAVPIRLPLPTCKVFFEREGSYLDIAKASQQELQGVIAETIPTRRELCYLPFIGYDIKDVTISAEDYETVVGMQMLPYFMQLSSFEAATAYLGASVVYKPLLSLGLQGYLSGKILYIDESLTDEHKIGEIASCLAEYVLLATTTQEEKQAAFEIELIRFLLNAMLPISILVRPDGYYDEKIEQDGLEGAYSDMLIHAIRAARFIIDCVAQTGDVEIAEKYDETRFSQTNGKRAKFKNRKE